MSDMDLTLRQAAAWVDGCELQGPADVRIGRVHTDSRSVQPGDLFFALRGDRFDGGAFIADAARRGAVAIVCEEAAREQLLESGLPGLVVGDTRRALGDLAAGWRRQYYLPVIAVTGSNGKTTVTQMIASVLKAWKPSAFLATLGNLNNDIGVPLTVLNLRPWHEVAVVELGMNHPGEIARLADIAVPTVAIVNNAQREHQEFMSSVDAVARENGSVLEALPPDGTAVFPADDAYSSLWGQIAGSRHLQRFATHAPGTETVAVVCVSSQWTGDAWQVEVAAPSGVMNYRLHVAGAHNVRNSLAAVAAVLAAGAPTEAIVSGLSSFEPVKGRSRVDVVRAGNRSLTVVDDTYNANPDSVRAAVDVLASLPGPRLLVLGDMGEVGDQGPAFHAEVGDYARCRGVDKLFGVGELAVHAVSAFGTGRHFSDMEGLQTAVLDQLASVASVVVKGSRFMRMERVVETIARHVQPSGEERSHAA